jgi:hypothetical protein
MEKFQDRQISRRRLLVRAASGAIFAVTAGDLWSLVGRVHAEGAGGDPSFITRVERPQDL